MTPYKIVLISLLVFISPVHAKETTIIAAASSTRFALDEIKQAFTRQTGLNITISYGSSGNLTRQLIQGAPFELFISADESYINSLKQQQLTLDDGIIYATGRLALFTSNNSPILVDKELHNLKNLLKKNQLQHFAIANPDHAPYGRAAKQVLINTGLWHSIKPFLVLAENASQTAQFASSGVTQGGIISYSYSLHPALKSLGNSVLIPQSLHAPFHARMVLMKHAKSTAKQFYQFLLNNKSRTIFNHHGFLLPID